MWPPAERYTPQQAPQRHSGACLPSGPFRSTSLQPLARVKIDVSSSLGISGAAFPQSMQRSGRIMGVSEEACDRASREARRPLQSTVQTSVPGGTSPGRQSWRRDHREGGERPADVSHVERGRGRAVGAVRGAAGRTAHAPAGAPDGSVILGARSTPGPRATNGSSTTTSRSDIPSRLAFARERGNRRPLRSRRQLPPPRAILGCEPALEPEERLLEPAIGSRGEGERQEESGGPSSRRSSWRSPA